MPPRQNSGNGLDAGAARPDDDAAVNAGTVLRGYLRIFRQRWLVVALLGAGGLAFGLWWNSKEVPHYTAEALIQTSTEQQSPLQGLGLGQSSGQSEGLASRLMILRSRAVLHPVIDSLGLRLRFRDPGVRRTRLVTDAEVSPRAAPGAYTLVFEDGAVLLRRDDAGRTVARARPGEWLEAPGLRLRLDPEAAPREPTALVVLTPDIAYDRLRGELRIRREKGTNIIRVQSTGPDPVLAAEIVNQVSRSYQHHRAERAREDAVRRRAFLANELEQVADSLTTEQERLQEYQERAGIIDPELEGTRLATALAEAESERRYLLQQADVLEGALDALRSDGSGDDAIRRIAVLGPDILPAGQDLYTRLRELQAERNQRTASRFGYTEADPRVEVLDSLIAGTREELRAVTEQSLALVRQRAAATDRHIARLRAEIGRVPGETGRFTRLRHQVTAVQDIFNLLADKYYEAQIREAVETGDIEIVDPATVPGRPNPSYGIPILLVAVALGLVLGGGCAILLEHANTRIRTADEVRRAAGVDVIGMIPQLPRDVVSNGAERPLLVAASDNRPAGEAFRMLRTSLHFVRAERPRVLAVSSAAPASGKSLVSANLAAAMAQQGTRVLVIDADMRRPVVHKTFDIPRAPGLSDVLVGDASLASATRSLPGDGPDAVETDVLPCGTAVPNPAEMLGSDAFRRLIETIREEYDAVIVDTPPVLAVTDAAVVGPLVDGMLVLAVAEETDRRELAHAVKQLRLVRAPLLGIVLNRVPPGGAGGSYGYYEYGYTDDGGTHAGGVRSLLGTARRAAGRVWSR